MKKLWSRFKRWLIRKLGGVDKEVCNFCKSRQPVKFNVIETKLVPVCAEEAMPIELARDHGGTELDEYTRRRIATQIGMQLLESKMIKFDVGHRWRERMLVMRGTVYVDSANSFAEVDGSWQIGKEDIEE